MDNEEIIAKFFQTPPLKYNTNPEELIDKLLPIALKYQKNVDKIPFYRKLTGEYIQKIFDLPIPNDPQSIEEVVAFLNTYIIPNLPSTTNQRFLAYIPSDPAPEAMVGAMLTPLLNQMVGSVQASVSGTAIEALVIQWFVQLLNLPKNTFGSFTTGGSGANLTCIYAGLVHQGKLHGFDIKEEGYFHPKRFLIYLSDQTHNSVEKAILMLGLGRKSIRYVKSSVNFELTGNAVRTAIQEDQDKFGDSVLPLMIIGNAGTTNSGAIDFLDELREVADEYQLWFHVDGAYGAFAKITNTPVSRRLVGLEKVDSLTLDAHKWFYVPFEAGVALTTNHKIMSNAFELSAEYLIDSELENDYPLQRNFRSYGFPLTRELRGLKIWIMLSLLGVQQIKNAITRNILQANYFQNLIDNNSQFELISRGDLGIVCFVHKDGEYTTIKILEKLQKQNNFYLSTTVLAGKTVIRACILNLRSDLSTMDELYNELIVIEQEFSLT